MMKPYTIENYILVLIAVVLMTGCISPTPSPTAEDIVDTAEISDPNIETEIVTSEPASRFTIEAEDALHAPLIALYGQLFLGESPVFVETDGDLVATSQQDATTSPVTIPVTFLPGVILTPQVNTRDVAEFLAFAISTEGQQILIESGHLPKTVTLTDQAGNKGDINQPLREVISTYGPATALVYTVGAEDRLIAASYLGARDPFGASAMAKIDPRFPEIMGDDFFSQTEFNVEEVALLDPDLIMTSARTAWLETAAQLEIPVFLFDAETSEGLKEAVLLTGQLFGPHAAAQGQAWINYYDNIIQTISEQMVGIGEDERTKVLFTGTDPLRVISGEMYQTEIIDSAGGVSVSSDLKGYWNDVNLEQIALWDPDVIIVPPYGGASIEKITENKAWQSLRAVKAGHVYRMPKLVVPWDTPAPDSVLGIVWMAQLLYPDRISLNCAEETEFFFNTFYNYAITAEEIDSICRLD